MRWACICGGFIFGVFIGKDEAPDVVGMKFGGRFAAEDVGVLAPYGELEYGVWYEATGSRRCVSDVCLPHAT